MQKIIITVLFLLVTTGVFAQITKEKICGKKWYPEKYKETDGKIYPLDKEIKALYTKFNCDGTFESWEDLDVFVTGTWDYDASSKFIKIKEIKSNVPLDKKVKIISCDGKILAFEKIDGGGDKLIIYSVAK
jgi:hypothetical protein